MIMIIIVILNYYTFPVRRLGVSRPLYDN
jgi:hypothetical protein